MLTSILGYISDYQILHKSEVDLKEKKRREYLEEHGANANLRKAPRVPATTQWENSNWYFMKTQMNNRFTTKQFLMMYFQYGTRKLTFDWIVQKIDIANDRIASIKDGISNENYEDKKSLLMCVRWVFQKMAVDYQLNCINGDEITPPTSLLTNIRAEAKRMIKNLIYSTLDDDIPRDLYDASIDEVLMIWEGGMNATYGGISVMNASVFTNLWIELTRGAGDIMNNHVPKNGPIMDQSKHLLCWIKWREYLGTENNRPISTIDERLYVALNAFARCAFGQLASMTSIFVLERNRF